MRKDGYGMNSEIKARDIKDLLEETIEGVTNMVKGIKSFLAVWRS